MGVINYVKKTWKNRQAEFPGRRRLTNIETGEVMTVDVERAEGTAEPQGDFLDASNLNDFENRVNNAFSTADYKFTSLDTAITAMNAYSEEPVYAGNFNVTGSRGTLYRRVYRISQNVQTGTGSISVDVSDMEWLSDDSYREIVKVDGVMIFNNNTFKIPLGGSQSGIKFYAGSISTGSTSVLTLHYETMPPANTKVRIILFVESVQGRIA